MNKVKSVTDDDQRQLISQLSFLNAKRICKEVINVKISKTALTTEKISKRIAEKWQYFVTHFSPWSLKYTFILKHFNEPHRLEELFENTTISIYCKKYN